MAAVEQDATVHDRVLLASEGRRISPAAIRRAAQLGRHVHVFTVVRVWGTGLGLPNPGLMPTKREWNEQRDVVREAVEQLRRLGVEATGQVLATRKAGKRIVREAERVGCTAIVMTADPRRTWVLRDMMWSQEPYRVQRRAKVEVHLVLD